MTDAQLAEIFADVPSEQLPRSILANGGGLPIIDALVAAGLAKSKGDARRTVATGRRLRQQPPHADVETRLTATDLASETVMVLRSGKKKYALLRFDAE